MAAPVIDRDEFTQWLAHLAENEEICGRSGDGYGDPIALFYLQKGYRGFAGRLCFFLGTDRNAERTPYPRWAELFIRRVDLEFSEPEDNGQVFVPADKALRLLRGIADERNTTMRSMSQ